MLKFAAIDIGSNAVRLLLTRVFEKDGESWSKKESLIRMPVRLGEDAFVDRKISPDKAKMLIETMSGFKHLIDAYGPLNYMACATSAMREAKNGADIVAEIRKKTGLDLQIIDGKLEAEIIYSNNVVAQLNPKRGYLYIDVGGGSTELTLFTRKNSVVSKSFKIGTVRLLKDKVPDSRWKDMKNWVMQHTEGTTGLRAIGSGGNINKLFRLANKKEHKPVSLNELKLIDKLINAYTYEDRIRLLGLRPDRADVIIPASRIYIDVMKWADINKIYVPQVGLADGIVQVLYKRYRQENPAKPA
ncbi:MAG: exopolyphosphatase [Calditrichia bacterium]